MNKYLVNWKTTSAGVLAIVAALTRLAFAIQSKDLSQESVMTVTTGILTGLGLIFARDFNKSSEQSGACTCPQHPSAALPAPAAPVTPPQNP